jgi:branched-chain amino acid transport system substrate-binding protein
VGLLADMTGPAASGNLTAPQGVQAGINLVKSEGYNVKYILADTGSSLTGAQTAAQRLVDEDHVFAVIMSSDLAFAAAPFLKSHHIPVIGSAQDGPEWLTDDNMFSPYGAGIGSGPVPVITTTGEAMKLEGVTNAGVLAYNYSTAILAAKDDAKSIQDAGIKLGYLNTTFPIGGTNVGPVALAMSKAGVNGFVGVTAANTVLATITALRQLGVTLKGAFLYNGYGGDLVEGGPNAAQEAQGVYFPVEYEPIEMHTAATNQLHQYMSQVGVNGDPSFAEYNGYLSIAMLVEGLKAAGANTDQAHFITALDGVKWNALGLLGNHYITLNDRSAKPAGIDGCTWLTKLEGTTFELVPGADPVCGHPVSGQIVSGGA